MRRLLISSAFVVILGSAVGMSGCPTEQQQRDQLSQGVEMLETAQTQLAAQTQKAKDEGKPLDAKTQALYDKYTKLIEQGKKILGSAANSPNPPAFDIMGEVAKYIPPPWNLLVYAAGSLGLAWFVRRPVANALAATNNALKEGFTSGVLTAAPGAADAIDPHLPNYKSGTATYNIVSDAEPAKAGG